MRREVLEAQKSRLAAIAPFTPAPRPERREEWKLKLDANENHFIDGGILRRILAEALEEVDPRFYPVEEFQLLREDISRWLGVGSDLIALGYGADQLVELLVQAFGVGYGVASISPTSPSYETRCRILGLKYSSTPLRGDGFELDVERLSEEARRSGLVFICSPNNPTANQFRRDDILAIVENAAWVVVVDEAYADFGEYSMVGDVERYDNLIVLRTFSKFFGLAGLRVGYLIAPRDVIDAFVRVVPPFNVPSFSLAAARRALRHLDHALKAVEELKAERSRLIQRLNTISGVRAFPSQANFIFLTAHLDSSIARRALSEYGVMARIIEGMPGLGTCFKITVGRREANDSVVEAFSSLMGGGA
ncbi:MAG: histidinol-phosphate aminotransferase family protein [Aigarchaeota archaeon]|nr:histidinol-phosphate aminotransferase family protein [Candidatus Pelearchaeum maunauluense]